MLNPLRRITEALTLADIAAKIDGELVADGEAGAHRITGLAPVDQAGPGDLAFATGRVYLRMLPDTKAGAVLVDAGFEGACPVPVIRVANPRAAFASVVELFYGIAPVAPGVHETAVVADTATVHPEARIDAYAVIGAHATVGAGCHIHPHVTVYDGASLGAGCVIHSGAVLREGVTLGERVIVHNGAVIGADGFGYEPTASRAWQRILQVGDVVIEDDAEIHAGACIDRAAVGTTRVGRGTKIDNLVQVGHGCRIGEDSMLCGQVGLAGSTVIGNRAVLGGQAGSAGHVEIGDDVQVGAKSGIMRDLEAGGSYIGSPAMDQRHARSVYLLFSKLPEMNKRVKALERALADLTEDAAG